MQFSEVSVRRADRCSDFFQYRLPETVTTTAQHSGKRQRHGEFKCFALNPVTQSPQFNCGSRLSLLPGTNAVLYAAMWRRVGRTDRMTDTFPCSETVLPLCLCDFQTDDVADSALIPHWTGSVNGANAAPHHQWTWYMYPASKTFIARLFFVIYVQEFLLVLWILFFLCCKLSPAMLQSAPS